MKYVLLTLTLICTLQLSGQSEITIDSLSIFDAVQFKDRAHFEDYSIEFKELLSDSRCPKDVICVRAGEAKIVVRVYKDNAFVKETQLTIHASGYISKDFNLIGEFDDYLIYGTVLSPYPISAKKTEVEDYRLSLMFRPKQKKEG